MSESSAALRLLASRLSGGPAFLIVGEGGVELLGEISRKYRWNGIYTSTTDSKITSLFSDQSRAVSSLAAMSRQPSRSQTDLEIRFLFGATHLPEPEHPPKTPIEEITARSRSNQELARLVSETVTPRGIILIEGWEGGRLRAEDLIPLMGELGKNQAHMFSAEQWSHDELISTFVSSGQLVIHTDSLESSLAQLTAQGALHVSTEPEQELFQHVIPLGDSFVKLDINIWNLIRRSARPVDIELLSPPHFSSSAARYQEFRNFVGATEGVPRWTGIAAGMNLVRDFESSLLKQVHFELRERDLPRPIILAGQTATGKSIALAALALTLARSGKVAVLHQPRRTVRPSIDDIDGFCAWASDHGATATVLIWDGMVDPGEYESISRALHARGRKFLLIGSAYKTEANGPIIIPAPAELSPLEVERLQKLLSSFEYQIPAIRQTLDMSFLALLYRLLPESEYQLRSGLTLEIRSAEKTIAKLVHERGIETTEKQRLTAMQAALQSAGLELSNLLAEASSDSPLGNASFATRAPIQQVTTLVLVAGRHGIPVPIDLALRILGREGFQGVHDALAATDIIREISDDDGNIFLGARTMLEAELLAQYEAPLNVEIEVIIAAIRNVRVTHSFLGGTDEVEFIVKLLERIGPKAENVGRYEDYFNEMADALSRRRAELGYSHPRLVLQESTFTRATVQRQHHANQSTFQDRIALLEYNQDLLEEVLDDENTKGLIRLSLSVELASTLGSIVYEFANTETNLASSNLSSKLDSVLDAVLNARAVDPENAYPVDVLAWATREGVSSNLLSPGKRVDHLANAIAVLDSLDRSSLSEKQLANMDNRGRDLNLLLKNDDAVWEHLGNLELNSSPAATYFLARADASEGPAGEAKALQRLRSVPSATREDWRCARLLIDLTWKEITQHRLLSGEREPLYLSPASIDRIFQLGFELRTAKLPDSHRLLFVRAMASFVSGDYAEARRLFREVADSTRQLSKRIRTSYLLADESNNPISFTGRVQTLGPRWGTAWVEQLGAKVDFEQRLFSTTGDLSPHQQLPPFYVGFKLSRGPIAEPQTMFRKREI